MTPIEHQSSTLVLSTYLILVAFFHDHSFSQGLFQMVLATFSSASDEDKSDSKEAGLLFNMKDDKQEKGKHVVPTAFHMLFWIDFIFLYLDVQVRNCLFERQAEALQAFYENWQHREMDASEAIKQLAING